jgi:hypothetical protein
MIDGSAYWPGLLVFLVMFLFAVLMFLGFGFALCRGVLKEQRRSHPPGDRLTP